MRLKNVFAAHRLSLAFFASLLFFVILNSVFTVCFETNDDVFFSMMVHGYGINSEPTLFLPGPLVIITYISRLIPDIFHMPGYVVLSIILLFIAIWAIAYFLTILSSNVIIPVCVFLLIALRAVLLPQFTVTAGLLGLAAVLSLICYTREKKTAYIFAGFFLGLCGFCLRPEEVAIVCIACAPLLPWKEMYGDKKILLAIVLLTPLAAANFAWDRIVEHDEHLQDFMAFKESADQFTNFRAESRLRKHPEIFQKYGYSENDLLMITACFFVDPKYTDTKALQGMLDELDLIHKQKLDWKTAKESLETFLHPEMLPLLGAALIVTLLLTRSRKQALQILLSWVLVPAMALFMGSIGRPGVLRVYFPMCAVLLVAPLLLQTRSLPSKKALSILGIIAVLVCTSLNIGIRFRDARKRTKIAISAMYYKQQLPNEVMYSWGGWFPYEFAYPVFHDYASSRNEKIHLLGGYTSAPFCSTTYEKKQGRDMLSLLRSDQGVLLAAYPSLIEGALVTYCRERFNAKLTFEEEYNIAGRNLYRIHCLD